MQYLLHHIAIQIKCAIHLEDMRERGSFIQNSCMMMNRKCQQIQDCSYLMQPTPKKFLHLHFRLETTGWGQQIAGDHRSKVHLNIIWTFKFYLTVWICKTIETPFTVISSTLVDEVRVRKFSNIQDSLLMERGKRAEIRSAARQSFVSNAKMQPPSLHKHQSCKLELSL